MLGWDDVRMRLDSIEAAKTRFIWLKLSLVTHRTCTATKKAGRQWEGGSTTICLWGIPQTVAPTTVWLWWLLVPPLSNFLSLFLLGSSSSVIFATVCLCWVSLGHFCYPLWSITPQNHLLLTYFRLAKLSSANIFETSKIQA